MRNTVLLGLAALAAAALVLLVMNTGSDPAGIDSAGPARPGEAPPEPARPEPPPPDEAGEEGEAEPGATARLEVRVRREDDSPVAGAVVRIVRPGSEKATTDADGLATLETAAGSRPVLVRAEGAGPTEIAGELSLTLDPGETREIVLTLREGGAVTGHVVDESGATVPGAYEVTLRRVPDGLAGRGVRFSGLAGFGPAGPKGTFPAGTETFEIPGVEPGTWIATASAEGRVDGSSEPFEVAKGAVTRDVTIGLTLGGRVSGVVVSLRTGEPVAGATVSLGAGDGRMVFLSHGGGTGIPFGRGHSAKTDDQGRFEIVGVPPGEYEVAARAEAFAPARGEEVVVEAGRVVSGLLLSLGEGGTLTGTVYDPQGRPEPGAEVLIQPVESRGGVVISGDFGIRAKAGDDGVYRAEHLEPGRYRVKRRAASRGTMVAISRVVVSGSTSEEPEEPEIPDDGTMVRVEEGLVSRFDVRTEALATIRGVLENSKGEPLPRKQVHLTELEVERAEPAGGVGFSVPRFGATDAKGEFRFEGLPPGRYRVSAGGAEDEEVSVAGGGTKFVRLRSALGSVAGIVVDDAGRPRPGAQISVSRVREEGPSISFAGRSSVRSDEEGRFLADELGPGRYRISARHGETASSPIEVEVERDGAVRDVRLVLEPTVPVTIVVRDGEGNPVEGAHVSLRQEDGTAAGGRTDARGEATIRVPPGTFRAAAFGPILEGGPLVDGRPRHAEKEVVVGRGSAPRVELRLE